MSTLLQQQQQLPMDVQYSIQFGITLGLGVALYFETTANRYAYSCRSNANNSTDVKQQMQLQMTDESDKSSNTTISGNDNTENDGISLGKKLDVLVYLILFGLLLFVLNQDYGKGEGVVLRLFVKAFPRECRTLGILVD